MKFIFISFTGCGFPIAKMLSKEGNKIGVAQIDLASDLQIDGWQGQKEKPEKKKRRLSLYDGLLKKTSFVKLLKAMKNESNKQNYFVVLDHNSLCRFGEVLSKWGYTGLLPLKEDYQMEKDRKFAQEFVSKNYKTLKILESKEFKKVEDGIKYVQESQTLLVLKSMGNLGETIIPSVEDIDLNKQEIVGALNNDKANYEKGGFLLEQKIIDPIEFTPQIAFWDGKPVYSEVELECKPIGAGDKGRDGGGAINLVVQTSLGCDLNKMAFPPVVYDLAKNRKGLFLFDAGILYDQKTKNYYFTEFAGNRWSWGGVFSELSMSATASNYFEKVSQGKNPYTYKFGATLSLYNIKEDPDFPKMHAQGIPLFWGKEYDSKFVPYQVKQDGNVIVNVDAEDILLGYVSCHGNTIGEAVKDVYEAVEHFSFKEVLYRPKEDFLSVDYPSAVLNRYKFLVDSKLI